MNNRTKFELYYKIVSGGARLKLLESAMDFNLPEVIGSGALTQEELVRILKLSPLRAEKWLYLLSTQNFLVETKREKTNIYEYRLGPILNSLSDDKDRWWFFKQMIYSWRAIAFENLYDILQGSPVTYDVNWPPATSEDSLILEEWMTRTAKATIKTLKENVPFNNVRNILDVGGGDGTISCALAKEYVHLQLQIYNLPEAIKLARDKIQVAGLEHRITVHEGNFLVDKSFPQGNDLVLFSRVLCDWPEAVCRKLLKMAYDSLREGGYIVICEPFRELNEDLSLVWEFRYMFWDNFGKNVFKHSSSYQQFLKEIGFKNFELSGVNDDGIYRVIKAVK